MTNGQPERTPDIRRTLAGHLAKNPYYEMTGQELSDHLGIDVVAVYKQTKRAGIDGWVSKKPMEYGTILAICRQYAHRNANASAILVREQAVQDNFNLSMSEIKSELSEGLLPMSDEQNEVSECPAMSAPVTEQTTPVPATHRGTRTLPAVGVEHLLALIVVGHSILVGCELYTLLAWPGLFAALVVFGLKTAAVVLSLDSRYEKFAADAVGVCLLLDILAVFLHRYTFFFSISALTTQRLGYEVVEYMCIALSLIVSGGSFAALFLIKKTANLQPCSAS